MADEPNFLGTRVSYTPKAASAGCPDSTQTTSTPAGISVRQVQVQGEVPLPWSRAGGLRSKRDSCLHFLDYMRTQVRCGESEQAFKCQLWQDVTPHAAGQLDLVKHDLFPPRSVTASWVDWTNFPTGEKLKQQHRVVKVTP